MCMCAPACPHMCPQTVQACVHLLCFPNRTNFQPPSVKGLTIDAAQGVWTRLFITVGNTAVISTNKLFHWHSTHRPQAATGLQLYLPRRRSINPLPSRCWRNDHDVCKFSTIYDIDFYLLHERTTTTAEGAWCSQEPSSEVCVYDSRRGIGFLFTPLLHPRPHCVHLQHHLSL